MKAENGKGRTTRRGERERQSETMRKDGEGRRTGLPISRRRDLRFVLGRDPEDRLLEWEEKEVSEKMRLKGWRDSLWHQSEEGEEVSMESRG
jgi:hypothetical protein